MWRTQAGTESQTFAQLAASIRILAAGFGKSASVAAGQQVAFFVNKRREWIATDFALQTLGAVSVTDRAGEVRVASSKNLTGAGAVASSRILTRQGASRSRQAGGRRALDQRVFQHPVQRLKPESNRA